VRHNYFTTGCTSRAAQLLHYRLHIPCGTITSIQAALPVRHNYFTTGCTSRSAQLLHYRLHIPCGTITSLQAAHPVRHNYFNTGCNSRSAQLLHYRLHIPCGTITSLQAALPVPTVISGCNSRSVYWLPYRLHFPFGSDYTTGCTSRSAVTSLQAAFPVRYSDFTTGCTSRSAVTSLQSAFPVRYSDFSRGCISRSVQWLHYRLHFPFGTVTSLQAALPVRQWPHYSLHFPFGTVTSLEAASPVRYSDFTTGCISRSVQWLHYRLHFRHIIRRFPAGSRYLSLLPGVQRGFWVHPASYSAVIRYLFFGLRWWEREVDSSNPSFAAHSPTCLHSVHMITLLLPTATLWSDFHSRARVDCWSECLGECDLPVNILSDQLTGIYRTSFGPTDRYLQNFLRTSRRMLPSLPKRLIIYYIYYYHIY
jgi:hypothetical protein